MSMKNVVSSLFVLLLLSSCDNKAEPVDESMDTQLKQEQYKQGKIDTHSTEWMFSVKMAKLILEEFELSKKFYDSKAHRLKQLFV